MLRKITRICKRVRDTSLCLCLYTGSACYSSYNRITELCNMNYSTFPLVKLVQILDFTSKLNIILVH